MHARVDALTYDDLVSPRLFDVPVGEDVYDVDFALRIERGTPPGNYEGTVTITAVASA